MGKKNCWEFKNCGRQPGGKKVDMFGVCPAATERRLDSVHDGTNAGRACWIVAGTMCKDEIQGTFAQKFGNCRTCDFYNAVQDEEFPKFQLTAVLMNRLS